MTNMARMEMLATVCMRFLVALVEKKIHLEKQNNVRNDQESLCKERELQLRRTPSARCRWAAPLDGRQRQRPELGWRRLSTGQTHQRSAGKPSGGDTIKSLFHTPTPVLMLHTLKLLTQLGVEQNAWQQTRK